MAGQVIHRYLQVGGVKARISEGGSGVPLLLIHGLGGPRTWQRVLEPLSQRFHLMAVDLPGFGETECQAGSYSTGEYAGFLLELLERVEAPKVVLCGISWGGEVAVRVADLNPGRVERLILLCSSGFRRRPFAASQPFRRLVSAFLSGVVFRSRGMVDFFSRRSYYSIVSRPPELCDQFIADLERPGRKAAWSHALLSALKGDPEFKSRVSRLSMPLLVVWGKNDAIVPVRHALEFQRQRPDLTLELFSECGHSIPLEKPRELVRVLEMFITREGSPKGAPGR